MSRRVKFAILIVGISLVCLSLVVLNSLDRSADVFRVQDLLAPTLFAPP
jgi:hypothetical protein